MTPLREAIVLPSLLMTVTLLGGVRIAGDIAFVPAPLFALVLAVLLLGALVRSGALAPDRLAHSSRPALANVNGAMVMLTLFAASAQVFHLVTPESGLPRLAAHGFFLVLLLNTWASAPDRQRLLQSLLVIFGSAFVLKFIVLAAVSDPAAGRLHRVMLVLLEGVTLGTLTQEVLHPAMGYMAFGTLGLYLLALVLLPSVRDTGFTGLKRLNRPDRSGEIVEPGHNLREPNRLYGM
jgi:hypothetical protein